MRTLRLLCLSDIVEASAFLKASPDKFSDHLSRSRKVHDGVITEPSGHKRSVLLVDLLDQHRKRLSGQSPAFSAEMRCTSFKRRLKRSFTISSGICSSIAAAGVPVLLE